MSKILPYFFKIVYHFFKSSRNHAKNFGVLNLKVNDSKVIEILSFCGNLLAGYPTVAKIVSNFWKVNLFLNSN